MKTLAILLAAVAGSPIAAEPSPIRAWFIAPTRVVWQREAGVANAANLLQSESGQAVLKEPQPPCVLTSTGGKPAGIVLDFGTELPGMVEIFMRLSRKAVGPSGFRFVRIDALDPKVPVSFSQVRAVLQMRDVPAVAEPRPLALALGHAQPFLPPNHGA